MSPGRTSPQHRMRPASDSRFAPSLAVALATMSLASGFVDAAASSAATGPSGTVKVLAAGSLTNVMTVLGAAFKKDTGGDLQVTSMGSTAIASGVASRTLQGDVFVSASLSADRSLEGPAHGNWITGFRDVGSSPVVLAYYPRSRFATALRTRPWYDVIQSPGFELGRTDPAVDPGGVLDVDALKGIGYGYDLAPLLSIARDPHNVYTEQSLPGLLQAGQLDAAFMYAVSADAARLPYVALAGTRNLEAHYTIATLKGAPDPAVANSFVRWLLSKRGASILRSQGVVAATSTRVAHVAHVAE